MRIVKEKIFEMEENHKLSEFVHIDTLWFSFLQLLVRLYSLGKDICYIQLQLARNKLVSRIVSFFITWDINTVHEYFAVGDALFDPYIKLYKI